MPTFKTTFILDQTTSPQEGRAQSTRDGGWTDNLYFSGTLSECELRCRRYALERANLLSSTGFVNGVRIVNVDAPGIAKAIPYSFPGPKDAVCDVPQMAFRLSLQCANGTRRQLVLAGVPDELVLGGAASFNPASTRNFTILNTILSGGFGKLGVVRSNPLVNVLSISTGGLVTTLSNHGLNANDTVRFFRTKDVYGVPVQGKWKVNGTPPSTTTFNLAEWNANPINPYGTVNGGKVRKLAFEFVGFEDLTFAGVTIRKVGRPFDQYRGRASRRRR
jgi:hypothetical protein